MEKNETNPLRTPTTLKNAITTPKHGFCTFWTKMEAHGEVGTLVAGVCDAPLVSVREGGGREVVG